MGRLSELLDDMKALPKRTMQESRYMRQLQREADADPVKYLETPMADRMAMMKAKSEQSLGQTLMGAAPGQSMLSKLSGIETGNIGRKALGLDEGQTLGSKLAGGRPGQSMGQALVGADDGVSAGRSLMGLGAGRGVAPAYTPSQGQTWQPQTSIGQGLSMIADAPNASQAMGSSGLSNNVLSAMQAARAAVMTPATTPSAPRLGETPFSDSLAKMLAAVRSARFG